MRPFHFVLLFGLLAGSALGDQFTITFTPQSDINWQSTFAQPWGQTLEISGAFSTDGKCAICTISQTYENEINSNGLLSVDITTPNGRDEWGLGPQTFVYLPMAGEASYDRTKNAFNAAMYDFDGGYNIQLSMDGSYVANLDAGQVVETGIFSIAAVPTPVPEPLGTLLQATALAGVGVLAALKRKVGRRRISFGRKVLNLWV